MDEATSNQEQSVHEQQLEVQSSSDPKIVQGRLCLQGGNSGRWDPHQCRLFDKCKCMLMQIILSMGKIGNEQQAKLDPGHLNKFDHMRKKFWGDRKGNEKKRKSKRMLKRRSSLKGIRELPDLPK